MRIVAIVAALAALSILQQPLIAQVQPFPGLAQSGTAPAPAPAAQMTAEEQEHLRGVLQKGSSSTVDLLRALESHLEQYPNSPRRTEIERALLKAAIEVKDDSRIIVYGERVLSRNIDDVMSLDRLLRALLASGTAENLKKALTWGERYEALLREIAGKPAASGMELARRKEEVDRALGRAVISQAIAAGNLGDIAKSVDLARRSFETNPTAEAAAELARRLAQQNRLLDAASAYADAFTISDSAVTDADRTAIRRRLGEVWQKAKGTETGLGDLILKAYDRNVALLADRRLALRQFDPNIGMTNPMEFTLSGIAGDKLPMPSLLGKAVILDFWATWCAPCRAQHPLYEKVKSRFAGRDDVVFLAINTDEERDLVKPFLKERGWSQNVYFEDGLGKALRVTSIPTTVVFSRGGAIVSRMNGYDPETFVDTLTDRIKDALK